MLYLPVLIVLLVISTNPSGGKFPLGNDSCQQEPRGGTWERRGLEFRHGRGLAIEIYNNLERLTMHYSVAR